MRLVGHPVSHGHPINHYTCGAALHARCSGFSGDYDTYLCGCCCHDEAIGFPLSDDDRDDLARIFARRDGAPHAR